jgi:hypothetical protein
MRIRIQIQRVAAIARLSAVDIVRQPVFLLFVVTCTSLTTLLPLLLVHQFGEEGKMVRDSALAFHFIFGLAVTSFAAGTTLAREVALGTAATVLSKPVSRDAFFLAKFLGIAAVALVFSICQSMATHISHVVALASRHHRYLLAAPLIPALGLCVAGLINYTTRRPFVSSAFLCTAGALAIAFGGLAFAHPAAMEWRLVPANALIAAALVVLSGILISLSTRLRIVPATAIGTALLFVGLVSDFAVGRFADSSIFAYLLYVVIPNWQHFWVTDGLSGGGVVPWSYVGQVVVYAALYLAGTLSLGIIAFRFADAA